MAALTWRRSSHCEAHSCVEVATAVEAAMVRDSKLGDASPILSFTPDAWTSFLAGLRAGDLRP